MRSTFSSTALATLVLLASIGCGPSMPDATRARAMHDEAKPLLDRIDRMIGRAIDAMPGADTSRFACARTESDPCVQARSEMDAAFRDARRAFARETLPSIARGTSVLGMSVVLVRAGTARFELGTLNASSPGEATGSTPVDRGTRVDERRIGYGLYQTSWQSGGGPQHGDATLHEGITVEWTRTHGNAVVTIRVVWLADGWRRPADWDTPPRD